MPACFLACRYCLLLEAHAANCGFKMPIDRLDLLLGPALLQYQYVICWLALLANLGVEVSSEALAECPGCWRQAQSEAGVHSAYIDFCFKLPHLAKASRGWGIMEPPNRHYFLPHQEVRAFAQSARNMQQVDDKDCSDFKAAEALARRSEKVCCSAPLTQHFNHQLCLLVEPVEHIVRTF